MILKKIHYVWIGKDLNLLDSEIRRKCFLSVYKYCKSNNCDFKLWKDEDFKDIISNNKYLKMLYDNKLYAFVADYFKYYIMYNEGGIYLDSDIEICKPLDQLLENNDYMFFQVFNDRESHPIIASFAMFAKPKLNIFKLLLDYYDENLFSIENPRPSDAILDANVFKEIIKQEDYQLIRIPFNDHLFNEKTFDLNVMLCVNNEFLKINNDNTYLHNYCEHSWNYLKFIKNE